MVGRNKMKDWKAAVRNWERTAFGDMARGKPQNISLNYAQRSYTDDELESRIYDPLKEMA